MKIEKYYHCIDYCNTICLSHNPDFPNEIDLCVLAGAHSDSHLNWKERIRWAWYIIWNGRIYKDDTILNKETAIRMARTLLDFSEKMENSI